MEIENIVGNCRDEWMVCVCEIEVMFIVDILIFWYFLNVKICLIIVWGGEWFIVNLDYNNDKGLGRGLK